MATLRKKYIKQGFVYLVDFRFQGRRYVISTKTSNPKIAREILVDIEHRIARGTFDMAVYEKKDIRLSDFFSEYFRYAQGFKSQSTIRNEKVYSKKFTAFIGDKNLRSVDIRNLDLWKTYMLQHWSPTTFNIERRFLHAALNVAVKWKYLDANPMSAVKMVKVEEKRNYFTDEELVKVFEEIDKDIVDPHKNHLIDYNKLYRRYVEFLLHTGLRRSEALNLKPKDVDLAHGLIYIEKTKGKKHRVIPLSNRAREIIVELGEELFSKLDVQNVSHKFNDILKRINLQEFKLHSTRHTWARRMVSKGVDIYVVKELLGHADIRTTLVYAKADVKALQDAIATLN